MTAIIFVGYLKGDTKYLQGSTEIIYLTNKIHI